MATLQDIGNIRNVVFDLGGVIIDLARENAVRELQLLGIEDADCLLGLYKQEEPFLGLETGKRTAGEVFDILRSKCKPGTSDKDIEKAFESFLVRIPAQRLETLRKLRNAGYGVYALSNTNPIMFHGWISREFRQEGLAVRDYFDGIVASFEEGMCKPDTDIFRTVLRRYSLSPDETLMLDDSAANCKAAQEAGMTAIRIDNSGNGSGHEAMTMIEVADLLVKQRKS